jgi:hypothetical protein
LTTAILDNYTNDTNDKQQATQEDPIVLFIMDGLDCIREELSGDTILFDKLDDATGFFDQADAFVDLSRNNLSVQKVVLFPVIDPAGDNAGTHRCSTWDKIAEGIGNLEALREIKIVDFSYGQEDLLAPDWEILACILRRLRRGIHLYIHVYDVPGLLLWNTEALSVFAGVIHGQAMITRFSTGDRFPFHCLDTLCSALLTLPALTNVSFEQRDGQGPEEGQSLESMIKLLQSPSLREVKFESIVFTSTLSQAVAKALKKRSEITILRFLHCFFPEGGSAVIASALETNTTLKCLDFYDHATDEVLYEVLAAALLSNSTLQKLAFDASGRCSCLSPLFLALQVNNGLKELSIGGINLLDEKLSSAMGLGLAKNTTLETLHLSGIPAHNDTSLWREALSSLRTNTALKTLAMVFNKSVTESRVTSIRMEVLAALRENKSLETLSMISKDARFEDYLKCVVAIQSNTTLKRFRLRTVPLYVDEDKSKYLISVLKKNYGLEALPGLYHCGRDVNTILQLNRAGRRYLVQDGSSISKGVDVLSRVNNDINSVFLHLLENPRLCDRSAVEISNIGNIAHARATPSPGNRLSGEKREHYSIFTRKNLTSRREGKICK